MASGIFTLCFMICYRFRHFVESSYHSMPICTHRANENLHKPQNAAKLHSVVLVWLLLFGSWCQCTYKCDRQLSSMCNVHCRRTLSNDSFVIVVRSAAWTQTEGVRTRTRAVRSFCLRHSVSHNTNLFSGEIEIVDANKSAFFLVIRLKEEIWKW